MVTKEERLVAELIMKGVGATPKPTKRVAKARKPVRKPTKRAKVAKPTKATQKRFVKRYFIDKWATNGGSEYEIFTLQAPAYKKIKADNKKQLLNKVNKLIR